MSAFVVLGLASSLIGWVEYISLTLNEAYVSQMMLKHVLASVCLTYSYRLNI